MLSPLTEESVKDVEEVWTNADSDKPTISPANEADLENIKRSGKFFVIN